MPLSWNEIRGRAVAFSQEFSDATREFWKTGMFAHAPPPVFRVPIIRFAPVHDGVDQAAVRILDSLRNGMRRIEMIMPK